MHKSYTKSAKYFELLMGSEKYKEETYHVLKILSKYLDSKPKKILDFGCGTGLHSIQLAKVGNDVTGIDKSTQMISIAKKKSKKTPVEFIKGNIYDWVTNAKFDACISMWNVIGYVDDIERTFININWKLKNGGLLIFDCFNGVAVIEQKAKKTLKFRYIIEENQRIFRRIFRVGYPDIDFMKQKFNMHYIYKIIDSDGKTEDRFEETHKMTFYTPAEIRKHLEDTGFEILEINNVVDNTKATKDDWDIRYIARKVK